jgi:hypothetical protein
MFANAGSAASIAALAKMPGEGAAKVLCHRGKEPELETGVAAGSSSPEAEPEPAEAAE